MLHIVLLLSIAGCGGMLQSSWTNFRAYHNTYYNAKHYYSAGLSQIEGQPGEIDPLSPVRIHPLPPVSGETDFENAIARGNRLLRDFPESKWADEAMEIIGKSHYYLHAFYPALRQFEELYEQTEDPELRYKAVTWKARVLFDLGAYEEGIAFLENELRRFQEQEMKLKSETELIFAEYHVQLGNREEAVSILRQALNGIERGGMKARAFFLLGQLLEIMERYGEAEYAYSMVEENLPEFDLLYITNMRKAGILRKRENREGAIQIYRMMIRDDKYLERAPHINYEIARTEEGRGNHLQAEQMYQSVLGNPPGSVEQTLRSDAYYRLGRIHIDTYEQFHLAAAYFDSAASASDPVSTGLFVDIDETNRMASEWREYSMLRHQLTVVDSLLWLGSLSDQDREAAISDIIELEQQRMDEVDRDRSEVLLNEESETSSGEGGTSSSAGVYGFLDYRNNRLLEIAQQRFREVWGSRVLADNWRQIDMETARTVALPMGEEERSEVEHGTGQLRPALNLERIPSTDTERQELKDEQAFIRYALGSLLMLALDQPEDAVPYFRSVAEEHRGHEMVPAALYALFDIYFSRGAVEEARIWSSRLRRSYPETIYTERLNERLGNNMESLLYNPDY